MRQTPPPSMFRVKGQVVIVNVHFKFREPLKRFLMYFLVSISNIIEHGLTRLSFYELRIRVSMLLHVFLISYEKLI